MSGGEGDQGKVRANDAVARATLKKNPVSENPSEFLPEAFQTKREMELFDMNEGRYGSFEFGIVSKDSFGGELDKSGGCWV